MKVKCIILPDYTFFLEHVTILLLRIKNNESIYFFVEFRFKYIPSTFFRFSQFGIFLSEHFNYILILTSGNKTVKDFQIYWTLDISWTVSYEITLVRLSVRMSLNFLNI